MESSPAQAKKWKMTPILPPELTEEIPLAEIYVGILKEKKVISTAMQSISKILPGMHHLKRCDGTRLLLDWVNPAASPEKPEKLSENELKQRLAEKGFDLSLLEPDFAVIKVPSRPVKTKTQAAQFFGVWPLNFHPDKFLQKVLSGSMFTGQILQSIGESLKIVTEAAEMGSRTKECGGSCMIVDAEKGKILSLAAARTNEHPMWHSSMLAIDLVAQFQGRGAWALENFAEKAPGKSEKRKYDEGKTRVYPKTLAELQLPEQLVLQSDSKRSRTKKEKFSSSKSEKDASYLCTGYWAFLFQEPCALCAMALLHSRVSQIFYCEENPGAGVLGSRAILHSLPGLNHRYRVWKASLE